MSITLVGTGAQVNGPAGTTELAVEYPAGLQADDLLVIQHQWNTVTQAAAPSGWTSQIFDNGGNSPSLEFLTKVAVGDETGTLTVPQGGGAGNAIMYAFRGVDPVTPMDVAGTSEGYGTVVTQKDCPSLTTTMVGVALVCGAAHNTGGTSDTPPSSPAQFTEIYDTTLTPASSGHYLIWDSSGATGVVTIDSSSDSRGPIGMIALRPLAGSEAFEATGTVEATSTVIGSFNRSLAMSGTVAAVSNTTGIIDGTDTGASDGSKRDMLMAELIDQGYTEGTISDRLYQREKETYEAGPQTYFEGSGPFSLSDYMLANGTDLNIIQ